MSMKIIFVTTIIFSIFFSIAFAQNYAINIENVGYGATPRDVIFVISNMGDSLLRNITISVDGKKYETLSGAMSPKKAFQEKLYLSPGEHFIEVKSVEGAYDSINVTVSSIKEKPMFVEPEKPKSFFDKNRNVIVSITFVISFVVIIWFLVKKPKLEL
jgi:hypothetical protein